MAAVCAELALLRAEARARHASTPVIPAEHSDIVRAAYKLFGGVDEVERLGIPRDLLDAEVLRLNIKRKLRSM